MGYDKSRKKIAQDFARNAIADKKSGDTKAAAYEASQAVKESAGEGPSMMGQVSKGSMASLRKGHAGQYTGNNPSCSKSGINMMGQPVMRQADSVMGQGPMGQAQADLAYNPVDDISGQGTEGTTAPMAMKGNSPFQNASKGYGQQLGKPSVATMYGKKK